MKASLCLSVPPHITELISTLEGAGHRAYVVGGAVRDLLLGRTPADWDIATDALPDEVKRIFPHHVPTGERFGTISVAVTDECGEQRLVEVTTFRSDGLYLDGRRPVQVSFGHTLVEDLARRDFTINALAWHPEEGLIDPYGGLADLRRRLISAVGDPAARFREDALRMLRAVRLAAQLRFRLSRPVGQAICTHRELIRRVAVERIQQELAKLLVSEDPRRGMRLLRATGLLALLLPELLAGYGVRQNRFHAYSIYTHCLLALQHAPPRLDLRLAALFHDAGKSRTQSVAEDGF
ncbi:MAG: hypothetical protein QJR13_09135, partial [Bacillota bacterium]|nr:hypothetical protein [Bacillota bacterium]